jgi:LysM repeat protein
MKKLVIIFILSFVQSIYCQESNSQHTVSVGETLSSIAQKYKITPYDIIKLNPNAVNGIKEKDVLIIPKSVVISNVAVVQENSGYKQTYNNQLERNQGVVIHIVQPKETKYGVSKLYGVTIEELEEQNPQIIQGLQIGHKLKILGSKTGFKQDLTQIDNPKVVYDSKFEYTVLHGETLYGISKRNGLTVDELTNANKSVLVGVLRSGQKLTIPAQKNKLVNSSVIEVTTVASSSKFHLVEPKETKYGLSKKYGISIEQFESMNPHIVNGLQIGQKVAIPSSYTEIENEIPKEVLGTQSDIKIVESKSDVNSEVKPIKTVFNKDEYVDYEIQPKETLFSLSKKAGMAIPEFTELNPKLSTAVQIGMVVKMPKSIIVQSNSIPQKTQTVQVETINYSKASKRYKDLTKSIDTSIRKELNIVLPFNDEKFKEYSATSGSFENIKDEFLKSSLEFYSGALKAIDSAKTLGIKIDVKVSELQNNADEASVNNLMQIEDLGKSNAVILPFYDRTAAEIALGLNQQNIPIITNQLTNIDKGSSNLYLAIPSDKEIRNQVLDYLMKIDANIIVVNSVNRIESKATILEKFPNAKFVKVSNRNVVDTDDLKTLLVKRKQNYVVLDTDFDSMIISSTNVLLKESTDFQIQIAVLEPSLLSNYENVSSIRINILKMIYPSFCSVEQSLKISQIKSSNYLMGFDLTFDTLLRLSQSKDFEASTKEDITEYLKYKFQYIKNKVGINCNKGFYILQHDTDNIIKELN